MTIEANKAIARREIEEYEGKGNAAIGSELFGPGYTLHFPGMPPLDRAGHENVLAGFREAFPDLRIEVGAQIASGSRVGNHWVARGTHRGPFQSIPATGKPVVITGNNVMQIEAGTIRELWGQLDAVGLLAQLGVVPGPPPSSVSPSPPLIPGATGGAEIVRRFVAKFNAGSIDTIADDFGEEYVLDFPGGPTGSGKDGIRSAVTEFRASFPDLHFTIDDLFEEGGGVVWRWTMTGTHRGHLGPFPPSVRGVALRGISILHVRHGVIVRDCVRADMAGLLAQIGAIPAGPGSR